MVTITDHDNVETLVENWDTPLQLHSTNNLYKLFQVVASEHDRIDKQIEEIKQNRFLESASGTELEKLGDLVGINRKTREGDGKLRTRIRGGFYAHASTTTYESFTSAALSILDARPGAVDFRHPPETPPKIVRVRVDGGVIVNNALTADELITLLNGSVSVDAIVEIEQLGTFTFDGDKPDTTIEQQAKGWDEGTWSVRQR